VQALGTAAEALEQAAEVLTEFFMSGKVDQVLLCANAFLESMAEVTIAHLLLEAAAIAESKYRRDEDDQSQAEFNFYSGKVMAAKFFTSFVLPGVHAKVATLRTGDRSALDIADGAFSTAY